MIKIKKKCVRFEVGDMLPIGLTLVVTGIGLAYGLDVLGDTRDDFITEADGCHANGTTWSCDYDYNSTADSVSAVSKLPEKLPLIVNVIVAAIIIGILIRYLIVRFG